MQQRCLSQSYARKSVFSSRMAKLHDDVGACSASDPFLVPGPIHTCRSI
jgi:hypothetical protein